MYVYDVHKFNNIYRKKYAKVRDGWDIRGFNIDSVYGTKSTL